ncbi:unnamed protein product [Symbiodinium sp. CCMP2592]|nr:unnamed protein product [Symbiodinium sp. CCMP2592]
MPKPARLCVAPVGYICSLALTPSSMAMEDLQPTETQQQELASAEHQASLMQSMLKTEAENMDVSSGENKRGTSEPEDTRRGKGGQKWPRGDAKGRILDGPLADKRAEGKHLNRQDDREAEQEED